jgi:hypothetical protein
MMKPILFVLLCLLLFLPAAQTVQGAKAVVDENAPLTYWRVGFMLTVPPTTANLANIPASTAVRLSSAVAPSDYYFVLPMSTLMQIQNVNLLVFDRSGSYADSYIASVEVYSLSGGFQRTLTGSSLDLQTAANNTWVTLYLSNERVLKGDEVLVIHFQRLGAAGGNLSLGVGLEVTGQNLTCYMPIILH